ncbi:MAG: NUDIX hydrolase, partial [Actinomycetes bacterium]
MPSVAHEVLAVVLQVRLGSLHVLLWRHGRGPASGAWALPGGPLSSNETLGQSVARQLAEKVDVREIAHLEQLETRSDLDRNPTGRVLATAYLGLIPADQEPQLPADTRWHPVSGLPRMAFDHASIAASGVRRLRAKLSYTNLGFALAPSIFTASELQAVYQAALGHDVDATNLRRILVRREQIEETGSTASPGRHGGRPAAQYRFRARRIQ